MNATRCIWIGGLLMICSRVVIGQSFSCDNSFYLAQVPYGQETSALIRMYQDSLTQVWKREEVSTDLGKKIGILGFRVQDNLLYGVTQPDMQLVRIDALGNTTELADLVSRGLDTARWEFLTGDVAPGGHILFMVGHNKETQRAEVVCTVQLRANYRVGSIAFVSIDPMYIDDIAYDPIYGSINTYDRYSNSVVSLAQSGSATNYFSVQNSDVGAMGGMVFDKLGRLWGLGRTSAEDGADNKLFRLNKFNGQILERMDIPPGTLTAACSCPYSLDYYKRISPDTTSGCERITLTYNIVNKTGTGQGNVAIRDTLPPGFMLKKVIKQPFLTTYTYDPITGIMEWLFRELVVGQDSLILELEAPEDDFTRWTSQASIGPLPLGVGTTLFSDNPQTEEPHDPTVLVYSPLSMSLPSEAYLCQNETLTLDPEVHPSSSQLHYYWQNADTTRRLTIQIPGWYSLTVSNACQEIRDSIFVAGAQFPLNVDLGVDFKVAEGDRPRLFYSTNAASEYELFWEFGPGIQSECESCEQPVITVIERSEVILTLVDANGCSATDTLIIDAEKVRDVWMPNVLTPNGDGVNEVLYLQGKANASFQNLYVVDRWGNTVFKRASGSINDPESGWNGGDRDAGVYFWSAELVFPDSTIVARQGVVTLLK